MISFCFRDIGFFECILSAWRSK